MKFGVVSDVHNNTDALEYALEAMRDCDAVFCLGDLVSQYQVSPRIVDLAHDAQVLGILGNHEKAILAPCGFPMRARLEPGYVAHLSALPHQRRVQLDGRDVIFAHGSPWDDPLAVGCVYVYPNDTPNLARLGAFGADLMLLGHTHVPMIVREGGTVIVNPGSCGEARGAEGQLTFGIIDLARAVAAVYAVRPGMSHEPILECEL